MGAPASNANRTPRGRLVAVTTALLALSACGGGGQSHVATAPPGEAADAAGFADALGAVRAAKVAECLPAEGGAYMPLPAPPAQAAAAAAYFRYLEGRIYQFGPCDVAPAQRNELRVFRYTDATVRDAAIREMAGRHSRPTSAFAVGDTFEAQIWSPDPSLEGPVGQAAAAVHVALGRMERSRHLDVNP